MTTTKTVVNENIFCRIFGFDNIHKLSQVITTDFENHKLNLQNNRTKPNPAGYFLVKVKWQYQF